MKRSQFKNRANKTKSSIEVPRYTKKKNLVPKLNRKSKKKQQHRYFRYKY